MPTLWEKCQQMIHKARLNDCLNSEFEGNDLPDTEPDEATYEAELEDE
jgi:hypothetical protein